MCPLLLRELKSLSLLYETPTCLALQLMTFSGLQAKATMPHHTVCSMMLFIWIALPLQDPIIPLSSMASTIALLIKHILQGNFSSFPSPNSSDALYDWAVAAGAWGCCTFPWQMVHISVIFTILRSSLHFKFHHHSFTPRSHQSSMQGI